MKLKTGRNKGEQIWAKKTRKYSKNFRELSLEIEIKSTLGEQKIYAGMT